LCSPHHHHHAPLTWNTPKNTKQTASLLLVQFPPFDPHKHITPHTQPAVWVGEQCSAGETKKKCWAFAFDFPGTTNGAQSSVHSTFSPTMENGGHVMHLLSSGHWMPLLGYG
jgi:hypothetical protein